MAKATARAAKKASSRKPAPRRAAGSASTKRGARVLLMVATKKGAWFLRSDPGRRTWDLKGPHFLGNVVNHAVLDPRDGRTLLMAVRTGHLGPTVFRSSDLGKTWKEAAKPPAFAKAPAGPDGAAGAPTAKEARAVKATFWLTPGHPSRPGQWWAGTTPHGLFTSRDGGVTWEESTGFSEAWKGWSAVPGRIEEVPEGAITHSVIVDPRDPEHLYVGLSTGGLFESTDEGATWRPLNRGVAADFLPEKNPEFGHDPHCVVIHPDMPDRLWQQNHCGIYRLERPGVEWERIGKNTPKAVGDIGFPIVLHPRDTDTAWVLPMDGTTVWPRTSVGGKPALYVTRDAGRSWRRQDAGLPARAWLTVKRQSLAADAADPLGLYFGTTSGEVWASRSEGDAWRRIAEHLPHVLAVTAVTGA